MKLAALFLFLNILLCTNVYCNKIMKINIEGNERIDDATIISYLNLQLSIVISTQINNN